MKKANLPPLLVLPALALMLAAGCASSPASRFFVLPPPVRIEEGEHIDLTDAAYRVGILPVRLAPYLHNPQIATRLSDEEIRVDEFNRWGIPLADGIPPALALSMLTELPDTHIDVYPWSGGDSFDCQVLVEIIRFDGAPGKTAGMTALWTVVRGRDFDDIVARRVSHYEEDVRSNTYAALAEAMSQLVARLGKDISAAVRELQR